MSSMDDLSIIEKLINSETFLIWDFQINVLFKANGFYEIVSGKRKYEEQTREEDKNDWNKKDAKAQKVIITSIDKKLMTHLLSCKTSKEMYERLCSIFKKDTEQQKCSILQEFFNFSYDKIQTCQ